MAIITVFGSDVFGPLVISYMFTAVLPTLWFSLPFSELFSVILVFLRMSKGKKRTHLTKSHICVLLGMWNVHHSLCAFLHPSAVVGNLLDYLSTLAKANLWQLSYFPMNYTVDFFYLSPETFSLHKGLDAHLLGDLIGSLLNFMFSCGF